MESKTLAGLFSLDHNIKLYVPSTVNVNEEATNTQYEYVDKGLKLFSERFGGSTQSSAIGVWSSVDKGLVKENVIIVESYASAEAVDAHLLEVVEFAREMKREMNQESVALEYDNKLYFV